MNTYSNPKGFVVGQRVIYSGRYLGTITCHYDNDLWEVRLERGDVCVGGSDLVAA